MSVFKMCGADGVAHQDRHTLPVRGAARKNFSALLRVGHAVHRLLGVLALCNGGDLEEDYSGLPALLAWTDIMCV